MTALLLGFAGGLVGGLVGCAIAMRIIRRRREKEQA